MARSLWLDLSLLPLLFLPVLLRLLPPQRAVPWARQPDRHGKSALLRRRKEWGHLERLFHEPKSMWLDNSRAQNPQRRTWISEQSPIRCRGTRWSLSMESVSNQNFTGDGEELTKVPIAVEAAKSDSYVQFIRIWRVLWRSIKVSSNKYTSSIRDKRNFRTSYTTSKRRNISCISAIPTGWWMVVRFYEMLLQSAKWRRPPGRRERRFGESFQDMPCSRGEFGKNILWLLRLKNWKS